MFFTKKKKIQRNIKRISNGILIFCFFFFLLEGAYALEFRDLSATELVQRSTQIIYASCISAEGIRMDDGDIFTLYSFSPHSILKGSVADPFSFRLHGGTVADESVMIDDMPKFTSGAEYVLFLDNGRLILSGSFQVTPPAGRPEERVLASIPHGLGIYDAASEKMLPSGREVSVEDFLCSIKKLMSENQ